MVSAVSCLLWAGCAAVPRPAFPIVDARQAVEREQVTSAELRAIRAEARVEQRGQAGRVRGTVLMFVERGERVRFDVMTQFGPVAILTSDRERFAFADFRAHRYLTGATCPKNIARLLGVPMSVDETSRFLLGSTPVIAADQREVAWDGDGYYRVELLASDGTRQLLRLGVYAADRELPAAEQRLYLLQAELRARDGRTLWRVRYDDHELVALGAGQLMVPYRVHVERPDADTDSLVRFKQIVLNPQIPEGAFAQTPRPGMQIEEASCD
jgi:hypothetical protein